MTQPSQEEVREWLSVVHLGRPLDSKTYRCAIAALALLDAGRKDRERMAEVREFVELLDWLQEQNGGNLFTPIGMDPRTSGWAWFGPGGKAGTIAVKRDTIMGVLRAVKERSDET